MLWQEAQNPGKGSTCKKPHVVCRTSTYICTCRLGNCYFHFIMCLTSPRSSDKSISHLKSKGQRGRLGTLGNPATSSEKSLLITYKDTTPGCQGNSKFLRSHQQKREKMQTAQSLHKGNWEEAQRASREEGHAAEAEMARQIRQQTRSEG